MSDNLNDYRHWYLYCKGWYKQTDIADDLRMIQSEWTGIEPQYITDYDVLSVMLTVVYPHVRDKNMFLKFMDNQLEGNVRFVGGKSTDSHIKRILYSAKSILMMASAQDIDGDLGEPDYNILPKRKEQDDSTNTQA